MSVSPDNIEQQLVQIDKRQNRRRLLMMGLLTTFAGSVVFAPMGARLSQLSEHVMEDKIITDPEIISTAVSNKELGDRLVMGGAAGFLLSPILMGIVDFQGYHDRRNRLQIEAQIESNKPLDASFE